MKNQIYRLMLTAVLVSLLSIGMVTNSLAGSDIQKSAQATSGGKTPTYQPLLTPSVPGAASDLISFSDLEIRDTVLYGPYDSMAFSFSLPPNWQLLNGSELQLVVSAFAVNESNRQSGATIGASLDVYFNGDIMTSIPLQEGSEIEYRIPIQPSALTPSSNGKHSVYIFLNAGIDCDYEFHKTTVQISSNSLMYLPYAELPLPTDLSRLPWPIYTEDSVNPTSATIVVPQNASSAEIRGAMIVAAGLGRMTDRRLPVSVASVDALTDFEKLSNHLIFVGTPEEFNIIWSADWPASVKNGKLAMTGFEVDDGLLQMTVSPWNPARVVLWAGGNSDDAVVKAAQAMSTGNLHPIAVRNLVVVADVSSFIDETRSASLETPIERTFSDMGYEVATMSGVGFHRVDYQFYVVPGLIPKDRPYIDLVFSSSSLCPVSELVGQKGRIVKV